MRSIFRRNLSDRSHQQRKGSKSTSTQRRSKLRAELLESRHLMASDGGGFLDHGLTGTYYRDANYGTAAFTRQDLRLDFEWGTTVKPGGSIGTGYRDVGVDNYSIRWTGQLMPKFTETYTFSGRADDQFKLELKLVGTNTWTTVVDQTSSTGVDFSGTMPLQRGQAYDVRISYKELAGAARVRLFWASPSTPKEIVDTISQSGINNPSGTEAFVDLVTGARNTWEPTTFGAPPPAVDANGWLNDRDGQYIFQESLNQGLDVDPLMLGTIHIRFRGKADITVWGNIQEGSLQFTYNPATNLTTGTFVTANQGWNASGIEFLNATRNGQAGGPAGITELKLIRSTLPNGSTPYDNQAIFTTNIREAMSHFEVIRFQLVSNQQLNWSERTLPSYFNQANGSTSQAKFGFDGAQPSPNGWSWEHKIMLANETGRDLMLSLPPVASGRLATETQSYLVLLANLIRYGSDGVQPYTSAQANPVYPPLNPNLRVYLEIGNELWNFSPAFYNDFENINQLTRQAIETNSADGQAINFDNLSQERGSDGEYVNLWTWRYRLIGLRLVQISNIFRSVFGDAAMPGTSSDPRIRPVYQWQYDNANETAERALDYLDRYFNKSDPASTFTGTARPVNYYLWGGGGAAYYGAINGNGLTTLMPNAGFDATTLANGYNLRPTGTSWTFTGTSGIARDGGASDDIPPAFNGSQVAYINDTGTMTASFTVPASHTSDQYAVSFKAHNRLKNGAPEADLQNLRVYLDYGTPNQVDLTARSFSQGDGYTPPGYADITPWRSRVVFWTDSDYYYTKSVALQPGSTHTITIRGMGNQVNPAVNNQTAFIDDVRVTSVDKVFADGIPGGGEANGQPAGQNIRNVMNTAVSWANAYGLEHIAYESGWSLGGDDGGSYVQLKAKYGDARTADAQRTFMDYYEQAGGAVNVFGTYSQWPSWADYYAEQGLIDIGQYPIIQGIDQAADSLPADVTNGGLSTGIFDRTQVTLQQRANLTSGVIEKAGGWLSWNVVIPTAGRYVVGTSTDAGGSYRLLVDDASVANGTSGTTGTATLFLTKGLHSLKVRSSSGSFRVNHVSIVGENAPPAPASITLTENNRSATLTWPTVSGASGYVLRYGTQPGKYTQRIDVGSSTSRTISGLTHNTAYYFAVSAYNATGAESLPTTPASVIALSDDVIGDLARWEATGLASGGETVPDQFAVTASAGQATITPVTRGSGLIPANEWSTQFFPDRFSSFSAANGFGTTLAEAISANQYFEFKVSPKTNRTLSLSNLKLQAWTHDGSSGIGIRYSTDGTTFTSLPFSGQANDESGIQVDLSSQGSLQNATTSVTFRIYFFAVGDYGSVGIGLGTPANDLVISGKTKPNNGGLLATYWNNVDFTGATVTRRVSNVNVDWGAGAPDAAIDADTFSARWIGQVQAVETGTYTFRTYSDEGVRLWVNGTQLIDHWTPHAASYATGTISLVAGQKYDIRIEYFEQTGNAVMRLQWMRPGQTSFVAIPRAQLTAPIIARLTGTVIGTAGFNGNTRDKVFDGSLNTFLDASIANGAWVGLDLGTAKTVTRIRYAPRPGQTAWMLGGKFQVSSRADFASDVVDLATITTEPVANRWSTLNVSNKNKYRYVRYISPDGSYGNIAEMEVWGT
jgi:hypothetical protein